jgi:hypothetical protein
MMVILKFLLFLKNFYRSHFGSIKYFISKLFEVIYFLCIGFLAFLCVSQLIKVVKTHIMKNKPSKFVGHKEN